MKLIDKAAVVAVIDEIVRVLQKNCNPNPMGNMHECLAAAHIEVVNLIKDSLDTLEVKEYDLDKEIDKWYNNEASKEFENVLYEDIEKCAKYFFELGLRYKSSYVSIPSIDDTLKEMGVDPDSKEAKSIKESYYMALDKLLDKFKAQKGDKV